MAAPRGMKSSANYFLIFVCFLYLHLSTCSRTLKLVHIVYRHGDRSPVEAFPTDPHTEDDWPQGFGQLSHIGEKQHYRLGEYFRKRYIMEHNFLSSTYDRHEIMVNSTNMDRTLMSAYSNLAGLYRPSVNDSITPNISWQPIPVHTKPLDMDNVLSTDVPCPRADQAFQQALLSPKVQREESDNRRFYDFVSNKTGVPHENISHVWAIYDTLFCEKQHNMTLPDWVNETFNNNTVMEKLAMLESLEFELKLGGTLEGRLRGGNLLGEVVQHMKDHAGGAPPKDSPIMYIYSAHDTTVAAFLSALQVYNEIAPPYTAAVMVELYKEKGGNYSVEVFYQNTTGSLEAYNLTLPGCSHICPLEKFLDITKALIPEDWEAECQLPLPHFNQRTIIGIGTAVGALFIIILVAVVTVCFRRKRAPPEGYFGIQQHA